MTPNDAQIDVLLRRYAKHTDRYAATEHLDADELSAFAEGTLPIATRSRYVSHLADCDDCRKLATQLTMTAGISANAEVPASPETDSWWRKLARFLALPALRYAAFAVVLIAVGGVTFFALRHQRESSFVAQNEPAVERQTSAVKQAEQPASSANQKAQAYASPIGTVSQAAPNSNFDLKQERSKALENPTAPTKPEKEVASADNPVLAGKRAAKPATGESQPSFAPPPPGEVQRVETKSREERDQQSVVASSGPRKSEPPYDKSKIMGRSRAADVSKDRATEGSDSLSANNQQAANQNQVRNQNRVAETNAEAPKSTGGGVISRVENERAIDEAGRGSNRSDSDKAPETRSVGGHKFRRQGGAWLDAKFKPSMSVTNISRGSEEFHALDSGLRSIANQISGEVVIVSKGKAYRIR